MANTLDFAKKLFSSSGILSFEHLNNFEKKHKIVVFVPKEMVEVVTFAMAESGAGKIGDYSVCSFRAAGQGTFHGGSSSNPAIGKKGKFEVVDEVRIEMVCDTSKLDNVVVSMLEVHPYEEPAYEIHDIISGEKIDPEKAVKVILKRPVGIKEVLKKLNSNIDSSVLSSKFLDKKIRSVVVDFSGKNILFSLNQNRSSRVLTITRLSSGDYNISFK